jgi:hypothetical protein
LKKLLLIFVFASTTYLAKAQLGFNYKEFGIGVGVSYERGYTNISRQDYHFSENINFTYNYSPFVPITAELQLGTLSGGGTTINLDPYGRKFNNNYKAFLVHGDYQLGEAIDYSDNAFLNAVKGFYAGSGFGLVFNSNVVQRTNVIPQNGDLTYHFPGSDNSINIAIPIRFGYEFKLFNEYDEPFMGISIGYVHNFVFGEGLDGYDDNPAKFKNNASNQYSQITVGVKFNFGNVTSYNKPIMGY